MSAEYEELEERGTVSLDFYNDTDGERVDWSNEAQDENEAIRNELERNFWPVGWGRNYNPIVTIDGKDTKEKLSGIYIPTVIGMKTTIDMPDDLKEALEKCVANGTARYIRVKHDDGAIKPYYQFVETAFYPMVIGMPKVTSWENSIIPENCYRVDGPMPDKRNLLGMVVGRETRVNKLNNPPTQSTRNFASLLVVFPALWEAGYIDSDGLPIPLMLKMTAFEKDELVDLIQRHVNMAIKARQLNPEKYGYVEPYMILCKTSHKEVSRKSQATGKSSDSLKIMSMAPDVPGLEYIDSVYQPDLEKRTLLRRLIKEQYIRQTDGARMVRPGGLVIDWCRKMAIVTVNGQRKWNPVTNAAPHGACKYGTDKPITPHIKSVLAAEAARLQVLSEEDTEASPTTVIVHNQVEEADYWTQVSGLIARAQTAGNKLLERQLSNLFAAMENDACTIEEVQAAIKQADTALNPPPASKFGTRRLNAPR